MKRFLLLVVSLVFVVAIVGNFNLARAELAEGVQVKPLRNYLTLDPGTTTSGTLSLKNTTDKTQTIAMSTELFSVSGQDYSYNFRDGSETEWVKFDQPNFKLKPDQTRQVQYDLAVPASASPGGHYFSLLTTIVPSENDGVREIRRVASLVYLEVSGDVVRTSTLTDFSLPWITIDRTIPSNVLIANSGNSHTRARVLVDGRSFWQRILGEPKGEFAVIEGTILPGTVRKLPSEIALPKRPGVYRLAAHYAPQQGGVVVREQILVYAPVWFLAIAAVFMVCLGWLIVRFVVSQKKYVKQNKTEQHKR